MSKHKRDRHPHENQPHSTEREQSEREQIQLLAYRYWEQRGSPEGDSEADWHKAENELARQREAATRL
jgi:hypothetical protein